MEGTREALGLRALVPRRGRLEGWLGSPACFVQRRLANQPNRPPGPGPFQVDKIRGKGPWGLPPSLLGRVLGPSEEEATWQPVCQTLDLAACHTRLPALPTPASIHSTEDDGVGSASGDSR